MVLSRYPIGEPKVWELPSTGSRRVVMKVPLDMPNGVPIDFYCSTLTLPEEGVVFPYVGAYGAGATDVKGWEAEQKLQAERLTSIVKSESSGRDIRVVIGATLYAGQSYHEGDREVLVDLHVDAYRAVADSFDVLAAPDYVPSCTQCADNPVLSPPSAGPTTGENAWSSLLFHRGIESSAIRSSEVTITEPVLDISSPGGSYQVPPSSHYGFRTHVHLTH